MTYAGDTAVGVRLVEDRDFSPATARNLPVTATAIHGDPATLAWAINVLNDTDVAVIQHEYGIYGGEDGDEVLEVLHHVKVPTIVVLHTVLGEPTPRQKWLLDEILRLAGETVVMSEAARDLLRDHYKADLARVSVIPHGVTPPTTSANFGPLTIQAPPTHRPVVLTWGLIGPGKGIEWGIRTMSHLTDLSPRPLYRVVGQTHPKVMSREGEAYRTSLQHLAGALGVETDVEFHDQYLDIDALAGFVSSAAAVLLPYDSTAQMTSGVLAEAVAAGKPVVATAFPHALELLARGAGVTVPHRDDDAMAKALRVILTNPAAAQQMSAIGHSWGLEAGWPGVGQRFRALAQRLGTEVAA
jgi:glycosyltransferase involved in cell wall biosynthesis